jgi:hypothetical protein
MNEIINLAYNNIGGIIGVGLSLIPSGLVYNAYATSYYSRKNKGALHPAETVWIHRLLGGTLTVGTGTLGYLLGSQFYEQIADFLQRIIP